MKMPMKAEENHNNPTIISTWEYGWDQLDKHHRLPFSVLKNFFIVGRYESQFSLTTAYNNAYFPVLRIRTTVQLSFSVFCRLFTVIGAIVGNHAGN